MNKEITVPKAIVCLNVITKKPLQRETVAAVYIGEGEERREIAPAQFEDDGPWPLYRFVAMFVAQRPDWQKPLEKLLRLTSFLMQLEPKKEGEKIRSSSELWCDMRDTLQADDFEIPFPYNIQLPPLANAILLAVDVGDQETCEPVPALESVPESKEA